MKLVFVLSLMINLTLPKTVKKHVQNSICPNYKLTPVYDITNWINRLQVQICTIIEVGDLNCALFIEDHSRKTKANNTVQSYFLGICDVETLSKWRLCNAELALARPDDCGVDVLDFDKLTTSPRVHRRFCDMHHIAKSQPRCKCETTVSGSDLDCVTGFPTCFLDPLPESLCEHYSACGFGSCKASTVLGRIHVIECGPNCIGEQPFCEYPVGAKTSEVPKISSFWSEWQEESRYESNDGTTRFRSVARCTNKETSQGAVDCLGPGTNCCPKHFINCHCHTYVEDGTLKVYRIYEKSINLGKKTNNMYLEIYDTRMGTRSNQTDRNQFSIHIKKLEKIDIKPISFFKEPYHSLAEFKTGDSSYSRITRSKRKTRHKHINPNLNRLRRKYLYRNKRDADDDMEDDDEDEDDLGDEDIAIEEFENAEETVATTEQLEEDEVVTMQATEIKKELNNETVLFESSPSKSSYMFAISRYYVYPVGIAISIYVRSMR